MIKRILLFLVVNFSALAIGGLFTGKGVPSDWYQNLNQAPWTRPGRVFGAAWTLIMICFAVYMAYLLSTNMNRNKVIFLLRFSGC
jgi:benzodiazapine receptor